MKSLLLTTLAYSLLMPHALGQHQSKLQERTKRDVSNISQDCSSKCFIYPGQLCIHSGWNDGSYKGDAREGGQTCSGNFHPGEYSY